MCKQVSETAHKGTHIRQPTARTVREAPLPFEFRLGNSQTSPDGLYPAANRCPFSLLFLFLSVKNVRLGARSVPLCVNLDFFLFSADHLNFEPVLFSLLSPKPQEFPSSILGCLVAQGS